MHEEIKMLKEEAVKYQTNINELKENIAAVSIQCDTCMTQNVE